MQDFAAPRSTMEANRSLTHGRVPIVELMLVVFALCVIATPIAVVYLLWRERTCSRNY